MQDDLNIKSLTGPIDRVFTEEVTLDMPFVDIAGCFADLEGTVALASGGDLDTAGHHILALRPWLIIKAWGASVQVDVAGRNLNCRKNPFELLRTVLSEFSMTGLDLPEPVGAGLFGYLAYDLKDCIEELPRTAVDDTDLPQLCMYVPSVMLVCDRKSGCKKLCIPVWQKGGQDEAKRLRDWFFGKTGQRENPRQSFSGGGKSFFSPFSRQTYMEAVEKIRNYIASGHIYQVNLSQRFETDFSGSPYAMFAELFAAGPASFYAYVNAGDHWIVSTSPERFLMRRNDHVESRPIKGTRPRGKDEESDRLLAEELKNSPKDDAELSMIVDLMRNDLGRVCAGGSVEVAEHRRLEAYRNVFHLVSVVRGRLAPEKDSVDLIRAAFPGGSVTGCPKIRAMEIIDEMEPCRRHVYTGSIGYIGFHDTLDLSIAIRTATVSKGRMLFSVGGGVVFDSDAEEEYEETLHKGSSIMSVFENRKTETPEESGIWMNGMLVPESEALVPVTEQGLQYGYGFFETIRVEEGRPHLLEGHVKRFCRTWQALFEAPVPDMTWEEIIRQVAEANNLTDRVCAAKLTAVSAAGRNGAGQPHIVVSASPYVHRLDQAGKSALDLAVYPHPRQTPLADHKTLNYLYYLLAGRWAGKNGADEAVILNPDGTVSETNSANLLVVRGDTVFCPKSPHVLEGVMETAVLEILNGAGFYHIVEPLTTEAFFDADSVIVTNSLMGPVGVRSVDGQSLQCDIEWIARLRRQIFEA